MKVMNPISRERILIVVKSHKDDIKSINQIDSKYGCHGCNLPSCYDSKGCNHKGDKHGPRLPEEHMRPYIIEPSDENRWDKYRETKKNEYRVCLRCRGRIYEVKFNCQDSHNKKCHKRESRSESGDSI